ncbi:MAG: flagellar hook-length control protein FliK [Candidatus Eremiobacteraeota bacterium]|nr:flagellar hook-length control protein FliK [Candidatus Eremiobacteraeota bacterium]
MSGSGVNPLAGAVGAAIEAAVTAELAALAADAQALSALLQQGDIVSGTVLPFNGLTDQIEIMGLRVAASLPPNVLPGDTLQLEVQGFDGSKVLVKVLSDTPAAQAPPSSGAPAPPLPQSAPPAASDDSLQLTATPIPVIVDDAQLPQPAASTPSAPQAQASGATASAAAAAAEAETEPSATPPPSGAPAAAARGGAVPTTLPGTPQVRPVPTQPETLSVEVRLALTRAATAPASPRSAAPPAAGQHVVRGSAAAPPPAQARTTTGAAVPARTPVPPARPAAAPPLPPARPPATTRGAYVPVIPRATAAKPPPAPIPGAPGASRPQPTVVQSIVRPQPLAPAALLRDPAALLRTLRIPVTPTALTFAKLVTQQPEHVATALRALEQSLPNSDDARIATLRTLATFVGELDPKSPTFTTQVASYLSHVVEGPESKLFSIVTARQAHVQAEPAGATAQSGAASAATAQTQDEGPAPPAGSASAQPAAQAQAAAAPNTTAIAAREVERATAATYDLKTQLLEILAAPAGPHAIVGDAGAATAQNALTALVTSQLSTLAGQQMQPGVYQFTVPIVVDQRLYPAKIQVEREKGEGAEPLTADDFHIAFILDTPNLGTVAIDMHAVGRSVSVAVKTEREVVASSFKSALAQLSDRLQSMKYDVKALDADVAPRRIASTAAADVEAAASPEAPVEEEGPLTAVDRKA